MQWHSELWGRILIGVLSFLGGMGIMYIGLNINSHNGDFTMSNQSGGIAAQGRNVAQVTSYNQIGGITTGSVTVTHAPARHLTDGDKQNILGVLSHCRNAPETPVFVESPVGDNEAQTFALAIGHFLNASGWKNTDDLEVISTVPFPSGQQIWLPDYNCTRAEIDIGANANPLT
jgi:hypothetical protein